MQRPSPERIPTPQRAPAPFVPNAVLDRLARASSGSPSTLRFKKGFRQPVLMNLLPVNAETLAFAGRAYAMRDIPARVDIAT